MAMALFAEASGARQGTEVSSLDDQFQLPLHVGYNISNACQTWCSVQVHMVKLHSIILVNAFSVSTWHGLTM